MDELLEELCKLAKKSGPGFDETFRQLHHFSHKAYSSKPRPFCKFLEYCGIHKPWSNAQNEQTVRRAIRFLELVLNGTPEQVAIAQAWKNFGLAPKSKR